MAIIGRAKPAPASTTPAPGKCDACKAAGVQVEACRFDSAVAICVHEAPCIARAKTAGIWKAS